MNMSFYTGATGMIQQQARMNVQGNNISNVNTHGFKAEKATFHNLMNRNVLGIDEELLPKGAGAKVSKTATDFSSTGFLETGRNFDFAIEGKGFFGLFDLESGEISYTRDGAFMMAYFPSSGDADDGMLPEGEWRLSDNEGRCVLDPAGNFIVIDPLDQDAELDLGVFDFLIYDGMPHADSSRFVPIEEKNGELYRGGGEVKRHFLEMSNVDLAQEFIKVIESQRAYTYAMRVVQTTDEIEQTINGLPN